ncbi:head maturation protease, ClpP-related [Bacteroides sp. 51]|uniref:head maturation protease, ClpP-related n=1 Tax=Bacteroides sp. 51 TaxID=2302938 RepID=UPI0013D707AD|nr:head maturation protease, ClpP-related [Bacteroides sp. 51]NDV83091.1 Clp protease ClpP [Bacteroides sp. 51]
MRKPLSSSSVFFNSITNEDNSISILLYGDIGNYDKVIPGDIVSQLMELSSLHESIEIHINSNGGDVFSGIAIYNALKGSKANITIYIDGVAASIAGVIALCGKPLYMSKYAKLMLHSVSCGAYGNKDEFKSMVSTIEDIEDTLAEMISLRCQKSIEEIKELYFDGKDHWISANEALEAGLINGIYDIEEPLDEKSTEDIYNYFNNKFNPLIKTISMNFINRIKELPSFCGMKTEEQIYNHIVELDKNNPRDARSFVNQAIGLGVITDKEGTDIIALSNGNMPRIRQYIEKKEHEYQQAFEMNYNQIIRNKFNYNAICNLPESFLNKELKALAKSDFNAFKEMVLKSKKRRVVDEIHSGKQKDENNWTLEDYRRYAPHKLKSIPGLYKSLLEQEKQLK